MAAEDPGRGLAGLTQAVVRLVIHDSSVTAQVRTFDEISANGGGGPVNVGQVSDFVVLRREAFPGPAALREGIAQTVM